MTRRVRVIRNIAIGLAALICVILAAVLVIVQTRWFRNYVREKVITATEDATGGKAEVGSFSFDVRHLRAVVTDFVIHGAEPTGSAPFVRAARLEVDLRLFTSIHRLLDIAYLGINRPEVNVIVLPDGRTNVPVPKRQSTSNTSTLQTVVDLAVGRFELRNGLATLESRTQPLDIRANNLQASLYYNVFSRDYTGQIALEPLYVASGRNTPVNFRITFPVVIQSDRIDIHGGSVATPVSAVTVDASIANMKDPKITAHVRGRIAMIDVANAANLPLAVNDKNVPGELDLDAKGGVADNVISVTALRATLGLSKIEAFGKSNSFQFKADLAIGELGRLAKIAARPGGDLTINGTANTEPANNYSVSGNIEARNLSFAQGKIRIANVNLFSALRADTHNIDLDGLRLSAYGGGFAGAAELQDFARYKLQGNLGHLDIQRVLNALGEKLPYDGIVSGRLDASGDKSAIAGTAHLAIAPGRRGIPLSGRINAEYNGAANNIELRDSYLSLPHSRVTLSGSIGRRLEVDLVSHDLNDFQITPVTLNNGQVSFTGAITGSLTAPRIAGHFAATRFSVEGRAFSAFSADLTASGDNAAIRNASLTRDAMRADFAAKVGLHNWSLPPNSPLNVNASVVNGDLADIMSLAGQPPNGYSGAVTATAHIEGSVGNPRGAADIQIAKGTIAGEPFDNIGARVNLMDQLVTIPGAYLQADAGRVSLAAEFHHPRDSFTTGQLHAHVQSTQVNLAQFRQDSSGTLEFSADVNGSLDPIQFLLTSVNADASAHALRLEGQIYGDLTAAVRTSGKNAGYNLTSDFAGSTIKVNGNTQLTHDYPTNAAATVANLPVERVLALAKQSNIPARGNLSGTIHFSGTVAAPQGEADLDLSRAVIYSEPLDHVIARVNYLPASVEVSRFHIAGGPSYIDLTGRYDHPVGNLQQGMARFNVSGSHIDLSRIHNLQTLRPGLGGTLDLSADGAASLKETAPTFLLSSLNASIGATGISAQGRNYGDLKLTANTAPNNRLNFALDSNLASAAIHGAGSAQLTGDYPVDARITFNNVAWTHLEDLLGRGNGQPSAFEAVTDGQVTVNGPVLKTNQLGGSLTLTRLNLTTLPRPGAGKPITIANQGPVAVALDRGAVRIESAHLTGPLTDIQVTGSASLPAQTLNLVLNANADLGVLQNFDRDIYSSGKVTVATTVRGTLSQPLIDGQATLQSATLNYSQLPAGISNANGAIVFNGNSARIQNLTAESGGGKLTASGFVAFANGIRLGVRAGASNVRVRVQQGVSVTVDSDIRLTGTTENSVVAGTVTIDQVTYAPQSDIGSMLSRAAPPVQSPTSPSPLLDNMKLDIRVRTTPGMAVQASLAENLQADADLRVRGTASQPGVLGRVTINEGQLVFFGAEYTVDTGSISFYNPVRIDPILDISLETQAKGVNVVLHVTGPIDNMNLSYTSDPPLQFQEIVSLLAAGKTPTSDPTLLANQPSEPAQGFQQMGESAIVGKAVADPVSSRLQRVFGVTQLKIDPSFTSGSDVPTARLTLQQRISSNITFTYVSAIDDPNSTLIRIEWAFNTAYSAVATRDQNGIFSINFFYKRQFR